MSDAVFSLVLMVTVAFVVINFYTKEVKPQAFATGVDWRLIPAAVLMLFALWILAALALACSTRLDMIPTLAICSAFFLVGIMSDYVFGQRANAVWDRNMAAEVGSLRWSYAQKVALEGGRGEVRPEPRRQAGAERAGDDQPGGQGAADGSAGMGGTWWATVLYTVTPNWQLFWVADALDSDKSTFHWGYVGKAFGYMLGYVGAVLAIGGRGV